MKSARFLSYVIVLVLSVQSLAIAHETDVNDKIKQYINDVVQKVEETEDADEKRTIMNDSFDKLINTFEKVENMNKFSDEEIENVTALKEMIEDRKDELNGVNGFARVQNNQLNNYASFVQQAMEQANTYITISAGLAVVIVLLLLLL